MSFLQNTTPKVRALLAGGIGSVVSILGVAIFTRSPVIGSTEINLTTPWARHTIVPGDVALTRAGSDGVDIIDVNSDGFLDVASPWEQSNKATESLNPGPASATNPWTSTTIPGGVVIAGSNPEAATYCDVDGDGAIDVVIGEDDNRARILFAPLLVADRTTGTSWTRVDISSSIGFRWMSIACADIDGDGVTDLIMGGKEDGNSVATVSIFESSDPRTSTSWIKTDLGAHGWVMSLFVTNVDGDSDLDIIVSDREPIDLPTPNTTRQGLAWYESDGLNPPTFTYHQIINEPEHKMISLRDWDKDTDLDIIDCRSNQSGTINELNIWRNDGTFDTFTEIVMTPPVGVGDQCQHVEAVDIDEDGILDLIVSYATVSDQQRGVVWLKNNGTANIPELARGDVATLTGASVGGEKYDNVIIIDLNGDGHLDILTSEQNFDLDQNATTGPGRGVIWYENPK